MKGKRFAVVLLSALLFTLSGSAVAQGPGPEKRERVEERIRMVRMWKLTDALDLTEERAAQIFPVLNRFERLRSELIRENHKAINKLRKALQADPVDEEGLTPLVNRIGETRRELLRIHDEEAAALKKFFSLEEQARYLLFQISFEREIHKIIAESKRGKRSGPQQGGPHKGSPGPAPDREPPSQNQIW